MESSASKIATGIAGIAVVILIGYFIVSRSAKTEVLAQGEGEATSTDSLTSSTSPFVSEATTSVTESSSARVQIALLDTGNLTQGKQRGCDRVVMVPYRIGSAQPSLETALQALFTWNEERVGDWLNFIARANNTLSYERSTLEAGTATVYLSGEISGVAGTCDDPRIQIQIEETAFQFPEVQRVQIYLNNIPTDIMSDEQG